MNRRGMLAGGLGLALTAMWPGPAGATLAEDAAAGEDLRRIESYLDGIATLQAGFVQIAADGGMSTGTLYLDRPGRMRLDYDPPMRVQIIAAHRRVVYYDAALQQVSYIPIGRTPLAFLLAPRIRLEGDVQVTGLERAAGEIYLTLVQTDREAQGEVTLVFGDEPLELRRWFVTDAQGLVTQVILEDVETGVRLARDLFEFRDPTRFPDRFGDPQR